MTTTPTPDDPLAAEPLDALLDRFRAVLTRVFRDPVEGARRHLARGLPPSEMRALLSVRPLSVFVPTAHGGRGGRVEEGLAVLETSAYESLAMSLTLGINGALFLQPIAKYADASVRADVFTRVLDHQNMGGLMMTEPGYGSDALNMRTAWTREGDAVRIRGTKHWAGLTGLADYWLMTARARSEDGTLARDVDFFVLDSHDPEQAVRVEERYENLGLYAIPYGRNRVDVRVPDAHRLVPHRSGLKMMLDLLHRSRIQFPGMGLGFLRRMADEALAHVQERHVGGRSLLSYDQVQRRVARLQASVTEAAAMCVFSTGRAGIENDLSKEGLSANIVKSVLTDRMHEAAQSLLQLVGAKGYRLDHIAGRSVIDARPFQIFEGSNDILYEQIAAATLQAMRRAKEPRLGAFLSSFDLGARAAELVRSVLDVRIDGDLPQRRLVDFGRLIGRVVSLDMVLALGERGYPQERIAAAVEQLRGEIAGAFTAFRQDDATTAVLDELPGGAWRRHLTPSGA
jgi:alkylation response protein AidB-like acyl-CoA dehydrogenase